MFTRARLIPAAVVVASALTLAGCAAEVPLTAAPDANNPTCAAVTVRLPNSVAGQAQRETNAQATGAWGTPATVLLHCGVAVPGPTTLPCVEVNGIDWIEDDSAKPLYRYTTFGRSPATEIVVDSRKVSGTSALVDLGTAVGAIAATDKCTDIFDSYNQ